MESTTMIAERLGYVINTFNLQTRLFSNAATGISDEHARTRPNAQMNHIAWLSGHVVSSRIAVANLLGAGIEEPYGELFGQGKGIIDGVEYPRMVALVKDWDPISQKLMARLAQTSDETLDMSGPFDAPMGGNMGDLIAFFAQHEAYTIGQIGILRRHFGYEAMKYS